MRHLLNVADLTAEEILRIFALTADLKAKFRRGLREPLLHVVMPEKFLARAS
ncbi:MAG TPA: hypothetical protein PJ982_02815, partial [Lacipirellulaceae bacterium]|nr:hypothetical protein [Lacipirellulaceae bacterium]